MPTINRFRPTGLTYRNSYGWAGSQGYRSRDVPARSRANAANRDIIEQQMAYEWYDYSSGLRGSSNPPFNSGAAGRLLPSLTQGGRPGGQPARVLRGFIRRAEYNPADKVSMSRLYFMYNPEVIIRDYVSYLDQGALDPFNTVFDSGNLVAPPSFMDFSFELFFDRQAEAMAPNNPGVFVDYEYFDLVVRNVVPRPRGRNNQLPDNGVMMVNPRDITVVFSPNITVQGRPLNARVAFEKFTHRMTPTRMRIQLTMRVVYIGPIRDMTTYEAEEFAAAQTIPWNEEKPPTIIFKYNDLRVEESELPIFGLPGGGDGVAPPPGSSTDIRDRNYATNNLIRKQALDYAKAKVAENGTMYSLPMRQSVWQYADCSSLICAAYNDIGHGEPMGFNNWPGTAQMISNWNSEPWRTAGYIWNQNGQAGGAVARLGYGDLLLRDGHVAFFDRYEGGRVYGFHAPAPGKPVGPTDYDPQSDYFNSFTYGVKPCPAGRDAVTNAGGQATRQDGSRHPNAPVPV